MPVLLRGYRERGRGVLGSRSNRGPGVSSYRNARRTGAGEHRVTARDLSETGNCYVVAFQYMLEYPSQEGLLLCHGPNVDFEDVTRGFCQEIFVSNLSKVQIIRIYDWSSGLNAIWKLYHEQLPNGEELQLVYDMAHGGWSDELG